MIDKFNVLYVKYMPKDLSEGILYISKEYKITGHLCPCGCGSKIMLPLGPAEWSISVNKRKVSLSPSIGNWQLPCRSHYWIKDNNVEWSYQFSEAEIERGRHIEDARRKAFYAKRQKINTSSKKSTKGFQNER